MSFAPIRESSSESDSPVIVDTPTVLRLQDRPPTPAPVMLDFHTTVSRNPRSALQSYVETLLEQGQHHPMADTTDSETNTTQNATSMDDKPKHYYKFFVLPVHYVRIWFDRLALLALLDRYFVAIKVIAYKESIPLFAIGSWWFKLWPGKGSID